MNERPTAESWERMFATLEAEFENLQAIANDDEQDAEVRELARAQLDESRRTLHRMRESRGFVPGKARL